MEFETLKLKLFLKMLRQYQLNGGIRRPQPRFGQSKRFGTTTTMAAPAAPTPWNRLPPLLNDFRWWDDIFLKFSLLESSDETPTAHKKNLAEPHHGKTHEVLVPTLEVSFPTINAASCTTVQGDETLKKLLFHSPQTTQS
jgi:hypothetical protein